MSKKNFETSLEKLENIVTEIESGNLSLDENIKKFEEGIKLYKSCKDLLSQAEKKITLLSDSLQEQEYKE